MDAAASLDAILDEFAQRFFHDTDESRSMRRYIRRFVLDNHVADERDVAGSDSSEATGAESARLARQSANILCSIHPMAANCPGPHKLHSHTYFELVYVYRGTCTQYLPEGVQTLTNGSFCLLNRSARHGIAIASDQDVIFNILISYNCFTRILRNLVPQESLLSGFFWESIFSPEGENRDSITFEPNPGSRAEQFIKSLLVEYIEPQPGYNQAMIAYLSLLFCELMRSHIYQLESDIDSKVPYVELIGYIDEHLGNVTLASLAEAFHYSEGYLSRLIRRLTGHTFSELLMSMRLNCSADYLEHTDMSIEKIAETLGFYDRSHYNRMFKKRFGMTPSAWRSIRTMP